MYGEICETWMGRYSGERSLSEGCKTEIHLNGVTGTTLATTTKYYGESITRQNPFSHWQQEHPGLVAVTGH